MFKITSNCSTHVNDLMELKSQTKTKTFFFFFFFFLLPKHFGIEFQHGK